MTFLSKLFGSNERELGKMRPIVEKINSFEPDISKLSNEELKGKTEYFKNCLNPPAGDPPTGGKTLEDLLPESFAVVRETAKRVLGERHFDVQLMGGIVLHQGKIAEMKTGEGKTLVSTLPTYLNALTGKGVHIVTVNDYLAKRDCNWMGAVYHALGVSTACIIHDTSYIYEPKILDKNEARPHTNDSSLVKNSNLGRIGVGVNVEMENLKPVTRRDAYNADITYGTNNEFGFDYLRDNMVPSLEQMSQRDLNYAIVDEVDSILIDEARTPLIISAPDSESTKLYQQFARIVPRLKEKEDYEVDEKMKAVMLTEKGMGRVEEMLGIGNIYEPGKIQYVHHLEQSLKANVIFKKDKDYVVKDGQVLIVDDFTGRIMHGRRYSEGLHQALEAKEGVQVQKESRTLATITFQNYFRMYKKLSGMTGTASTSAEEFSKVYKLDVTEIPTNKPMIRKDLGDVIYKSEEGKFKTIVEKIKEINSAGQPVLVGTIAIEKSEYLSSLLSREGIEHQVLNAKYHEKEAAIIAKTGQLGAVTIATNMAGRGTDIKLGKGVKESGGLYIIGTERHEARRIDNQLRGRSGRQGDPGATQFYASLEDELMRRFGGDKLHNMMDSLGLPEDQPIQNAIISKSIESAQSKIEGFNFDIRKHVLDYDDVMNKQREVIYGKRRKILAAKNTKNAIVDHLREQLERIISVNCIKGAESEWDVKRIFDDVSAIFPLPKETEKQLEIIRDNRAKDDAEKISLMTDYLLGEAKKAYNAKEREIGAENMRRVEKLIMLQTIDNLWMNHLDEIDYLRQGIGLRGYGQRDPLIEYKREAFSLFTNLMENIRSTIVNTIFRVSITPINVEQQKQKDLQFKGADENVGQYTSETKSAQNASHNEADRQRPIVNKVNIGRNDPCPCGSGKKFKKCCGR